jgi:energy-coupling factor transporter ATP-binding protein EcfA2
VIRFNDRVLIVGKTGSGKTVLARHLFDSMRGARRTAVDPKGRLQLGITPARSTAAIDLAAPVSHFIPGTLEDAEYEEAFSKLWHAGGPRVVWLDESFGPTRAGYAPQALRFIVQQGREVGVGLIACSQRPVNIEATLRTEAEHLFIFVPAPHRIDLDSLALEIGCSSEVLAKTMRDLQAQEGDHSHLWYRRNTDELVPCAPLPAAYAHRGQPVSTPAQDEAEGSQSPASDSDPPN